jgi:hypothetical protein
MRGVLLVVAGCSLAGCDLIFELSAPATHPCDSVALSHDEDGDGFDDSCDRCPAINDPVDPDGDGDGVGDRCDPKPDVACERRQLFEGFGSLPENLVTTDDWGHLGDDLEQPDSSSTTATAHYPTLQFTNARFRASVTIVSFDELEEVSDFLIGSGGTVAADEPSSGYACSLHRDLLPSRTITVRLLDEGPDSLIGFGNFSGNEINNTFTFELANTADGTLECTVEGPQGKGTVMKVGANPMATGEIFLFADDVNARVHWIEVLENTCL